MLIGNHCYGAPFFADRGEDGAVNWLAVHQDLTLVRGLQKIQASEQCGLTTAGGADNGQHLTLF